MAVHVSLRFGPAIRLATGVTLAAMCAACSGIGDPAGYSIVTQDMYDFRTCSDIIGTRTGTIAREKELVGLIEKADSSPGGIIVSYTAYRSELTQVRAMHQAVDRAARLHNCDAPKKPDAAKKP